MNYTTNYSSKKLRDNLNNFAFLEGENLTSSRNIDVDYNINVDVARLASQARTFAMNLRGHPQLHLSKALKCREEKVEGILFNVYIYSYVKCLHNGFFHFNFSESANLGLAFMGHASLFNVLKSPIFTSYEDDVFVTARVQIGGSQAKWNIIAYLLASFPFLKDFSKHGDAHGTNAFFISNLEVYLGCLLDSSAHPKAYGDLREDESPSVNRTNGNNRNNNNNGNSANRQNALDNKNTQGKLSIVTMDDVNCASINFKTNYPLTNAFNSYYNNEFFFIPLDGNQKMEFNPSVHFARANFIGLARDYNSNFIEYRFYKKTSFNDSKKFLVVHDVHAITGIKGKYFESSVSRESFNVGNIKNLGELVDYISTIEAPTDVFDLVKIIEKIKEEYSSQGK
jgi:hypothetical protein